MTRKCLSILSILLLGLVCFFSTACGENAYLAFGGDSSQTFGENAYPASQWGVPAETLAPITPQPSSASPEFFFRGGIRWNMNREQVRALEPIDLTERTNGSWSVLIPLAQVEVSRYQADLVYMFENDQLKMIQYEFGSKGSAYDYTYLTGALDSVYGTHAEAGAAEIVTLMDRIYPSYYRTESITKPYAWTAMDGTRIYQFYYSPTAYTILYANPADSVGVGGYVTTGL